MESKTRVCVWQGQKSDVWSARGVFTVQGSAREGDQGSHDTKQSHHKGWGGREQSSEFQLSLGKRIHWILRRVLKVGLRL